MPLFDNLKYTEVIASHPSQVAAEDIGENNRLISDTQIKVVKKWFELHPTHTRTNILKYPEINEKFILEHFREHYKYLCDQAKKLKAFSVDRIRDEDQQSDIFIVVYRGKKANEKTHPGCLVGETTKSKVKVAQELDLGDWPAYKIKADNEETRAKYDMQKFLMFPGKESEAQCLVSAGKNALAYERSLESKMPKGVLLMPLSKGESLYEFISKNPRKEPLWWLQVAINICQAVDELHVEYGMLHRDIKLANLIVNEETGEVELIDFGLSHRLPSSGVYIASAFHGTCGYDAPELSISFEYSVQSEIYALGVTLGTFLSLGEFNRNNKFVFYNQTSREYHENNKFPNRALQDEAIEMCRRMISYTQTRPAIQEVIRFFKFAQYSCKNPLYGIKLVGIINLAEFRQLKASQKTNMINTLRLCDKAVLIDSANQGKYEYLKMLKYLFDQEIELLSDRIVHYTDLQKTVIEIEREILAKSEQMIFYITNLLSKSNDICTLHPDSTISPVDVIHRFLKNVYLIDAQLELVEMTCERECLRLQSKSGGMLPKDEKKIMLIKERVKSIRSRVEKAEQMDDMFQLLDKGLEELQDDISSNRMTGLFKKSKSQQVFFNLQNLIKAQIKYYDEPVEYWQKGNIGSSGKVEVNEIEEQGIGRNKI